MIFLRMLAFITLALFLRSGHTAQLNVTPGFQSERLGPGVAYLEDKSGSWPLAQVLGMSSKQWAHEPSATPTFGYSPSAYWFKFDIGNQAPEKASTLLEVGYPMLNHLDVYVIRHDGTMSPHHLGSGQAVSQRLFPHRNFVIPVELDRAEVVQVYLRVQTTSSVQVPITLWSPHAFNWQDNIINILYGAYLGLVVIMFAYNCTLLIGTGDRSYLYYLTWVSSIALFVMTLQGISLQYLWPAQVQLNDQVLVLVVVSIITSALLFSTHFLQVHKAMPKRLGLLHALIAGNGVTAVASFLLPYSIMIRVAILSAVVITTIVGQMSIQRWREGYKPARYFAISWGLVLLGGVAMSLSKFGLITRTVWTEHSVTIGSALEIVLLNLALADRFNGERRARAQAQAALMNWQQKHNEMLEAKVAQRTKDLELANWQLKQYVNRMSRLQTGSELGSGLIHELRQPLAALQSFAQGAVTLINSPRADLNKLRTVMARMADTAKRGNVMLDRMRAFLTQDSDTFAPFNLSNSIREAMVWLRPSCQQEGVSIDTDGISEVLMAHGDDVLTQQIVVNLLRNAVDAMVGAGSPERVITISTYSDAWFAYCKVTDTGPGVPSDVQEKLFVDCHSTKPDGMGLGLKLSRSIAQEMRGDLTIEASPRGASFLLSIPLAKHVVSNLSAS